MSNFFDKKKGLRNKATKKKQLKKLKECKSNAFYFNEIYIYLRNVNFMFCNIFHKIVKIVKNILEKYK